MILFVDIETVSQYQNFMEAPKDVQLLWSDFSEARAKNWGMDGYESFELYSRKAAFYAEFARVACVSLAYEVKGEVRCESWCGEDEESILTGVAEAASSSRFRRLVGHNIKGFDVPFFVRRMLIAGMLPPPLLQVVGRKPWEVQIDDTMEMWQLCGRWHNVSLDLICRVLGIETPKESGGGDMVHEWFYSGQYDKIRTYCEADVKQTMKVYDRLSLANHSI